MLLGEQMNQTMLELIKEPENLVLKQIKAAQSAFGMMSNVQTVFTLCVKGMVSPNLSTPL